MNARPRCRRRPAAGAATLAAAFAAAGLLACRPEATGPASDAVARVGGEELSYGEFAGYVERQLGERGSALGSDVLSGLFDRFLDERLLAALAAEQGLVPEDAPPRLAVETLLDAGADRGPTATDVAAHYEAHREEFLRPERVRLRQALFEDRDAADRARAEIAGGAAFADAVRRHARQPAGVPNGVQAELARDELPAAFADTIFRLRPGEISPVIEAEYGFHLFQVVERLPAAEVPLAEARVEIARRLARERADARLAELVAEARDRYNVTVLERNLPFNYQGRYRAENH